MATASPTLAPAPAVRLAPIGGNERIETVDALRGFALLTLTAARKSLGLLAPAGRMALTNYLLQSLVSTFVFYGYGLGMLGKLDAARGLVYCVTFWLVQLALSHWWMNRFAFGPVEWLWRTLTYGKRQPMRIERSAPRPATA